MIGFIQNKEQIFKMCLIFNQLLGWILYNDILFMSIACVSIRKVNIIAHFWLFLMASSPSQFHTLYVIKYFFVYINDLVM